MRPRTYHRNTARRVQRNAGNSQPFFQPATSESEHSTEGSFFNAAPTTVQAQLTVGQPGDRYEQEADAMADRVVGMAPSSAPAAASAAAGAGQGVGSVQRSTPKEEEKVQRAEIKEEEKVQRAAKPEEEEQVQRAEVKEEEKVHCAPQEEKDKPAIQAFAPGSGGGTTVSSGTAARLNSTKGGGSPLPTTARQEMSGSFGHDFSTVRIHTDSEAASLSDDLGAHAFTLGEDVYFNRGKFNPDTQDGKRLLAHELTHVVQQTNNTVRRYRSASSMNFGVADGGGLKEEAFNAKTDKDTKPWIESIDIQFAKEETDIHGNLAWKGILTAKYYPNKIAPGNIILPITGGSSAKGFGISDAGSFTVHRIEGIGYNSGLFTDKSVKRIKGTNYSQGKDPLKIQANMHFAVFYNKGEALHRGQLDESSHGCIHVSNSALKLINYHSVINLTKVNVSYP